MMARVFPGALVQVHRARVLLAATAAIILALPAAHAAPADKKAEREALKTALVDVLQRTPLKASRVGIYIQSLDDGSVVFSQNADDLLNPASNVKLVTSAAALASLGPEYRFDTEFLVDPELPPDGKIKTLYVRGKGDPSMTTERLYGVVSELYHAGLREVQDIIIDDSWFDSERTPPGYDQEESDRAYMAPTGAVSLNWNATAIFLRAGETPGSKGTVEMEPNSDFFVVENGLTTGSHRARRVAVASKPLGDKQRIIVKGQLPSDQGAVSVWKKIDNPPMYFGFTMKELLKSRGIKVKGKVKLGLAPSRAKLVHVSQSDTFDIILKRLNKLSNNFVAETLLKTMGAELKGSPGSFQKGIEVVEAFLERDVGIQSGSYVMKNGSGLNDTNRFSATQLSRILRFMYSRFPLAPEYMSSVGIAGKDGTLKYRFEGSEAVGRLRAKTGTLENVSALSGFVQATGGEMFVFSMMVNDYPGRSGPVVQGLDALGAAVAATGSSLGPSRAVAAISDSPRTAGGELAAVTSRIKTYLELGKQHDQRNISFLRTAWRSERDPAVRAVLADSLYQSNPSDYLGARTLLDSYSANGDVYGRLRAVARELSVEVPGVGSMVELAAGGNAEALARVVELAGASRGDGQAENELAEALGEVARTAPEELVVALREAGTPERDVAVTLLARGLVQAGDADHPFWKSLRKQLGAQDPAVVAFVRNLDATLSQKVAQQKAPRAPDATEAVAPGSQAPPGPGPSRTAETRPGG